MGALFTDFVAFRFKVTTWNISIVALFRAIKHCTMLSQMYLLMVRDAAIYIWTFIIASTAAFALALYIDTETALSVVGHC